MVDRREMGDSEESGDGESEASQRDLEEPGGHCKTPLNDRGVSGGVLEGWLVSQIVVMGRIALFGASSKNTTPVKLLKPSSRGTAVKRE